MPTSTRREFLATSAATRPRMYAGGSPERRCAGDHGAALRVNNSPRLRCIPGVEITLVDPDPAMVKPQRCPQNRKPAGRQADIRKVLDDKCDGGRGVAPDHGTPATIWAAERDNTSMSKPVSHNLIEGRRMVKRPGSTRS